MLFSIIIPFYNSEQYLFNAISSALEQYTRNFFYEVIVINDCSTDNSLDIANKFSHKGNYVVIDSQVNSGPGSARNKGIEVSQGRYVIFLDSDDYLSDNALYNLYEYLELNNYKDDLISYNWKYSPDSCLINRNYNGGRRDYNFIKMKKKELLNAYLSMNMDNSVIYNLIRKSTIVDNDISFSSGLHEDIDYMFKVYYHSNIVSVFDKVLYYKRDHLSSIINQFTEKNIVGYIRAWKEMFNFLLVENEKVHILSLKIGVTGTVGMLISIICERNLDGRIDLLNKLYSEWAANFVEMGENYDMYLHPLPMKTKYDLLTHYFFNKKKSNCSDLKILKDLCLYLK